MEKINVIPDPQGDLFRSMGMSPERQSELLMELKRIADERFEKTGQEECFQYVFLEDLNQIFETHCRDISEKVFCSLIVGGFLEQERLREEIGAGNISEIISIMTS